MKSLTDIFILAPLPPFVIWWMAALLGAPLEPIGNLLLLATMLSLGVLQGVWFDNKATMPFSLLGVIIVGGYFWGLLSVVAFGLYIIGFMVGYANLKQTQGA